jgi:acetyl esterase/lipase
MTDMTTKAPGPVTLSYGPDPLQEVIVYPGIAPNSPIVGLVHGDGFRSSANDALHLDPKAKNLQAAGLCAAILNYRDSLNLPTALPPVADQISDVAQGLIYVVTRAGTYNGDPDTVSIIGGSAGGFLAASACLDLNGWAFGDDSDGLPVRSLVTLSATTDFSTAWTYWLGVSGPQGKQHITNISEALGTSSPTVELLDAFSPAQLADPANVPKRALIINNTHELQPVQQAAILTDALRAAGGPGIDVDEQINAGVKHSWAYWDSVKPTVEAFLLEPESVEG